MSQIGKIDEIFGTLRDYSVSVKLSDNMRASSFTPKQKLFIDPAKLLPLSRFLPQPPKPKIGKKKGDKSQGGAGGGFNSRGGGFGGRGGKSENDLRQSQTFIHLINSIGGRGGGGFRGGNRGGGGGGGFSKLIIEFSQIEMIFIVMFYRRTWWRWWIRTRKRTINFIHFFFQKIKQSIYIIKLSEL
jgi:hypothetical protein